MLGDTDCQNNVIMQYSRDTYALVNTVALTFLPLTDYKVVASHILSSFPTRTFKFILCIFGKTLTS
jgi:hypothetical protein